jgi:hypothetical protein
MTRMTKTELSSLLADVQDPAVARLLTELFNRLDVHAAAIRKMKQAGEGQTASRDTAEVTVTPGQPYVGANPRGTYVPTAHCYACSGLKEAGRERQLTCLSCSVARTAAINGEIPRPSYKHCGNCGHPQKGGMTMLCVACRESKKKQNI